MTTVDAASMTVPSIVPGFVSIYTSNGRVYAVLQLGSSQLATASNSSFSMTALPTEAQSSASLSSSPTVKSSADMSMLNMELLSTSSYNPPSRPSSFMSSTSPPPHVPEAMTESGTVSSTGGGLSRAEMAGIAGVVIGKRAIFPTAKPFVTNMSQLLFLSLLLDCCWLSIDAGDIEIRLIHSGHYRLQKPMWKRHSVSR